MNFKTSCACSLATNGHHTDAMLTPGRVQHPDAALLLMILKIGSMSHEPLRMMTSQFFGHTRGMLSIIAP